MERDTRGEAGFTLIEMLVAMAMGLVVLGAVLVALIASLHTNARQAATSTAANDADIALARIARDVRQASAAAPAGGVPAGFGVALTMPGGTPVVYACTPSAAPYACTRSAGGKSAQLVSGVVNTGSEPVFTIACNVPGSGCTQNLVQVSLKVRASCDGQDQDCRPSVAELHGGAVLRNVPVS